MKTLFINDCVPLDAENRLIDTGSGYVLETEDNRILFLNELGRYIVFHCDGKSIEEIVSNIHNMISDNIEHSLIRKDVECFIEELIHQNIARFSE